MGLLRINPFNLIINLINLMILMGLLRINLFNQIINQINLLMSNGFTMAYH
jgi:hypothetical protein